VGRRTCALGCRRAAAAGVGSATSTARWTVELRADQLLGLPGNPVLEPAVQPVRFQLLRGVDPAVRIHLTQRPLRRLAKRALTFSQIGEPHSAALPLSGVLSADGKVAGEAVRACLGGWPGARRRRSRRPRGTGLFRGMRPGFRACWCAGVRGATAAATRPHPDHRQTGEPGTRRRSVTATALSPASRQSGPG
jgi:hypothetical protein